MEPLSREQVQHIAALCRIAVSEEELERYRSQLTHILEQMEALQRVNTEGVEPAAQSLELAGVVRPDEVGPGLPQEQVLANAPRREEDFFRVRAVLED
ncbi:MAG: Asp-tRNA(Asn)/Glu-tRNA(Gln) amidotransferase subunit GatC [Dehalococcoidia bacterium]|nr:Asp-tRNA(Asn)/Glu-tRNA(Gln) amidotransferase subunit GatC [Dehalococcoidia bacterium]